MDHPICRPGLPVAEKTGASGFVAILPHLEEKPLYDRLDVPHGGLWNRNVNDLYWYGYPDKSAGIRQVIAVFRCPSDRSSTISTVYAPVSAATGSYAMVQGSLGPDSPPEIVKFRNNGMFNYVVPRTVRQIQDGLSKTIAIGEVMLADSWESSNTWSYGLIHADSLRTTRNALNTTPGSGIELNRQNGALGSSHPGGANFCHVDGHVEFVSDDIDIAVYVAGSTIRGGETNP